MTAALKISDNAAVFPLVIAGWNRNAREVIRVALDRYEGRHTIKVRVWYRNGHEIKPGKSGLALGVKHLPALADAVAKALVQSRELGLIDDTPDNNSSRDRGVR
jgi:hypothetical protein